MKKRLITLACLAFFATANAEKASEESIKKLFEVTDVSKLSEQMMNDMVNSMQAVMKDAPEEFWTSIKKEADVEDMINKLVPVYQKHLEQAEVDAAIAFYETPEGKKFTASQPKIMQESMAVGIEWGQALSQKILSKYQAQQKSK